MAAPEKFLAAKMSEATGKLNTGEYKRAAMLFSAALDISPEDKEANRGLVESHKGIKLLMMSNDDVDGASKTLSLHLHRPRRPGAVKRH